MDDAFFRRAGSRRSHRLANEFGADVELRWTRHSIARRTDTASAEVLAAIGGCAVYSRPDGSLYALFENPYWLQRVENDHPDLTLEPILTH